MLWGAKWPLFDSYLCTRSGDQFCPSGSRLSAWLHGGCCFVWVEGKRLDWFRSMPWKKHIRLKRQRWIWRKNSSKLFLSCFCKTTTTLILLVCRNCLVSYLSLQLWIFLQKYFQMIILNNVDLRFLFSPRALDFKGLDIFRKKDLVQWLLCVVWKFDYC
jgi:hypothetical protein